MRMSVGLGSPSRIRSTTRVAVDILRLPVAEEAKSEVSAVAERALPMTRRVPPVGGDARERNRGASGSVLPCSGTSARRTLRSRLAAGVRRLERQCDRPSSTRFQTIRNWRSPIVATVSPAIITHAAIRRICAKPQNCYSFQRPSLRRVRSDGRRRAREDSAAVNSRRCRRRWRSPDS